MLAITDAKKRGFDEAILLNEEGYIAEGSGQNIFIVKNDVSRMQLMNIFLKVFKGEHIHLP